MTDTGAIQERHAMTSPIAPVDCGVCGNGRHMPGTTTVTLTRGEMTLVFRHVPADICDVCGDDRLDVDVAKRLERIAEAAIADGVRYEVREYKAA